MIVYIPPDGEHRASVTTGRAGDPTEVHMENERKLVIKRRRMAASGRVIEEEVVVTFGDRAPFVSTRREFGDTMEPAVGTIV